MFLGPQKLERGSVTRRDFTSQNVFRANLRVRRGS